MSAAMLCAAIAAIRSLMWPVFGTPAGTGVSPGGGIAMSTPGREDLRLVDVPVLVVDRDEAHRVAETLGLTRRGRPR